MSLKITENELIKDGFTRRFAKSYIKAIEAENSNPRFDKDYLDWAHEKGFYAEHALSVGVSDSNFQEYVSDYDWCKMWPLNGWQRIWVNDKMTLKYMLAGTEYDKLMPECYFYMSDKGLRELIDNPYKGKQNIDTLLRVIKEKGSIAAKPNNGTLGAGFLGIRYSSGDGFSVNGEVKSEEEIKNLILKNKNYIYTEFLEPCEPYKSIDSRIHTMRIIVLNEHGNDPVIYEGASIRFANQNYEGANLLLFDAKTKEDAYNLYVRLNIDNGEFRGGKKVYGAKKAEETENHPVTGIPLKGKVEDFDKVVQIVLGISERFNGLTWLGFDLCMSENGLKVIEINTHPGMTSSQVFMSVCHNDKIKNYIEKHLREIDGLSEEEKVQRAYISR